LFFSILRGKKQISPLLAPLEKFWEIPLLPPLEKILPTPMSDNTNSDIICWAYVPSDVGKHLTLPTVETCGAEPLQKINHLITPMSIQ